MEDETRFYSMPLEAVNVADLLGNVEPDRVDRLIDAATIMFLVMVCALFAFVASILIRGVFTGWPC